MDLVDTTQFKNLPKTRGEAKQYSSNFYFTGKPCKNGKVVEIK